MTPMESHIAEFEGRSGIPQPVVPAKLTFTRKAEVGSGIGDPGPDAGSSFGSKIQSASGAKREKRRRHRNHPGQESLTASTSSPERYDSESSHSDISVGSAQAERSRR